MTDADFPALGFDPARGDVASVNELATQMSDTGKYANEAYEVLKSVQDKKDVWTGNAADAFAGKLGQLPEYLDKGHTSLEEAAKALSTWGERLAAHQTRAKELEAQAKQALADAESKDGAARAARDAAQQQPDNGAMRDDAVGKINAANAAWDRLDDLRR